MNLEDLDNNRLAKALRDSKQAIKDHDKALKESAPYVTLQKIIAEIEVILTKRLHDSGATSIATPNGTIHTVGQTTARIMDPVELQSFVIEGRHWGALDWKANMTWCRDWTREHNMPVPGVELNTTRRLSVTAPKGAKEDVDDVE